MTKKISWGRKLARTFVRLGTNRTVNFTGVGTLFIAYTKGGDLQVYFKANNDGASWETLMNRNYGVK